MSLLPTQTADQPSDLYSLVSFLLYSAASPTSALSQSNNQDFTAAYGMSPDTLVFKSLYTQPPNYLFKMFFPPYSLKYPTIQLSVNYILSRLYLFKHELHTYLGLICPSTFSTYLFSSNQEGFLIEQQ